jgi:hypothetical protein
MITFNFNINFTNSVGCLILIYSVYYNFNSGILAGVSLMLGRKTHFFNN